MPTVNPSAFGPKPFYVDAAGDPLVGGKLFAYVAGSTSTKQNTYTDSTGNVANPNPIILNALGQTPNGFWWPSGALFKIVLAPATDTDPPTNPVWTVDNLQGMNDVAAAAQADEWQLFGAAPTFVNATTFTLAGNQTDTFQAGRRIRTTNTAGPTYSTIISSVFAAQTTVTVANTSGALDSGLSAVYYGILSVLNPSYPNIFTKGPDVASAAVVNLTTTTGNSVSLTGTTPVTAWTMFSGQRMWVQFTTATPITHNAVTNRIQGGSSITGEVGSFLEVYYDGTTTFVTYILTSGAAPAGPSYTSSGAQISTTGTTLLNTVVGTQVKAISATATSTTLPSLSALADGQSFTIINQAAGAATFVRSGADSIFWGGASVTSFVLQRGDSVTLTRDNASFFLATSISLTPQVGSLTTGGQQTFSTGTATKFSLNTANILNPTALVDAANSQFVIQVTGGYAVSFTASGAPSVGAGIMVVQVYKNGSLLGLSGQTSTTGATIFGCISGSGIVLLTAGDIIDLRGTNSANNWVTQGNTCTFNIQRVY